MKSMDMLVLAYRKSCSFICKITWPGNSEVTCCSFQVKVPPVSTCLETSC